MYTNIRGMSPWMIILIVVVVLFMFFAVLGNKESKQAGKKAAKILSEIESKYNDFVERKMYNQVLSEDSVEFDAEDMVPKVMIFLKPDIQALIAFVNSTIYSGARTEYKALYFSNIPHVTNEMFVKSTSSKDSSLSPEDEKRFFDAFQTAVESDLQRRIGIIKTGNF